jgi:hypothetical protein
MDEIDDILDDYDGTDRAATERRLIDAGVPSLEVKLLLDDLDDDIDAMVAADKMDRL